MNDSATLSKPFVMKRFRSPRTVLARFTFRRNLKTASIYAVFFGAYIASKGIGFVKAYPSEIARQKAIESFSSNAGLEALLGPVNVHGTTASYIAWNSFSLMLVIGCLWGMLLATRLLRGEEDAGRWEILLTGQTTARRAVFNVLAGISACLLAFYVILTIILSRIGSYNGINFDGKAASFYALSVVAGIGLFMLIGAFTSQIMSTRAKATGVATGLFVFFYALRAIGDITSAHWILYFTPLGWLEKLQPLAQTNAMWLLPLVGLGIVATGLTLYFAGKRDLGESIIADKPSKKAHLKLLNSPILAAFRLTRANAIGWLVGILASATLYGSLTNSVASALNQTKGARHIFSKLDHQSQISVALAFLGVVFLIQMIVIMMYAASSMTAIRREEAEGYADNILVRPISRKRWLGGRLLLSLITIALAGALTLLGVSVGIRSHDYGVNFHTILLSTINMLVPVVLVLGFSVFTFGIRPRLTTFVAYGLVAWSFLIDILSSGVNLSHWIMDTSILNQMKFAPATSPNWSTNLNMIILAIVLMIIGFVAFSRRDLVSE